ncbi:hypothetical protein FGG08_004356 [Glutinoglossum americanum]|uniref:Meiotically up-regulated protein Msb1/Mug8 domain-containing protein n=1 Tax=Glutinoglossum americanum TaxID=1670608 RepID=A0A9P8HWM8_9PEZI|nr:hypothetical protein FGG08_004356 [Glutinoglossum americanum]
MPAFFSKVFRSRDSAGVSKKNALQNDASTAPPEPRWQDSWLRNEVSPEEVQELLRGCTQEIKSRALDMPFLLLPFRPTSDPSALRTFIRNFFKRPERGGRLGGDELMQELRLTEPMVLCSVVKWCWSRLPGGVVTWEAYELFRVGEHDSNMARDSFATFIPISVESDARAAVIFDFFDLMAAVAAHGKANGLSGRKLSRLAGWWAFEHSDMGNGFDGGYKSWASAADATSHLFFAYLRSLSPDSVKGVNGISTLPLSLQTLLHNTEYPPETPTLMQSVSSKVVMIVDSVSPTPFALLRRARNFDYRDDDRALQAFASYEDPVQALTDECRRVLKCISSINQSAISSSKNSTSLPDASWSRFEDIGFSGIMDESDLDEDESEAANMVRRRAPPEGPSNISLSSAPRSRPYDLGRPTTPSWADFLSSGFVDEPGNKGPAPLLLPPDKVLPPIDTSRVRSSQSNKRMAEREIHLEPGELASINKMDLDDAFWWVWMASLAGEEPTTRKAVFGRCAVVETHIKAGRWLIVEEKVKGAAVEPEEGAYIVEKKSRFGLSKRARLTRRKSTGKKNPGPPPVSASQVRVGMTPASKTSIGPDQHARIQLAAAALQQRQKHQADEAFTARRPRNPDGTATRTNSVFTLQPVIMSEALPAMKWANKFDKDAIREAYLANSSAGKGQANGSSVNNSSAHGGEQKSSSNGNPYTSMTETAPERALPLIPRDYPISPISPISPTLPDALTTNARSSNAAAAEAAKASLPSSPKLERKPIPAPIPDPQSPSVLSPDPVLQPASQEQAPKKGLHSAGSIPNEPRKAKKLRKREAGGSGFKKFFGRKKDMSDRSVTPQPDDAPKPQLAPPQPISGRRLSILRKKTPPTAPQPSAEVGPSGPISVASSALPTPVASPRPEPRELVREPARDTYQRPQHTNMSAVSATEERAAARAFSSFDQGPLSDVPAFVPDDDVSRTESIDRSMAAIEPDVPRARESTHSLDSERELAANRDRWAQIRENAAKRVAAKTSEEQSRPSQAASADDGETSGEETIESRVARIKARVAELTGHMDNQNERP